MAGRWSLPRFGPARKNPCVGTVIAVHGLRKIYAGAPVVDGISFKVAPGEIFGILGPNGAGETTTVECLQGLRRGESGQVSVLGMDPWRDASRMRPRIGSQLQESGLSVPRRLVARLVRAGRAGRTRAAA